MSLLLRWPAWAQMWALAFTVYVCCKWLSWLEGTHSGHAPFWRQCAYLLAWPGMDAASFFANVPRSTPSGWRHESIAATAKLGCGLTLFFAGARMVPPHHEYVAGWIGMTGIVLTLHFGVFHLLSCWWKGHGLDARPLMDRPLASTGLGEFWGRRWNTAFRDLTHRFLFRPAASIAGSRSGIAIAFLASGAVHDLVISVPARGGYGGPTLYFAIQGAATMLERSAFGRAAGLGCGWRGRVYAATVLLLPAGLLFHRPFVVGIVDPFMHAMGAL